MSTAIAPETVQIIRQLEPREDVEAGLRRVLENEMRRRIWERQRRRGLASSSLR